MIGAATARTIGMVDRLKLSPNSIPFKPLLGDFSELDKLN